MVNDKFIKYMDEHEDELVADIFKLCRINSERTGEMPGSPYGVGPRMALASAEVMAKAYGFKAEVRGDRVLCIEFGEGEPQLGMLAHLDVVPAGTGWTKAQPYDPVREGDMLYGRGVSDDKGPAVASLYALRCVKELGLVPNKRVQLLLGSCEETGSDDVDWYMKHYSMPPMVFTPDGDYPVANVEKGRAVFTVKAPYAPGRLVSIKAGTVANAVPGSACAVLEAGTELDLPEIDGVTFTCEEADGRLAITAHGVAAHASLPQEGKNTACALLEALNTNGLLPESIKALAEAVPYGDYNGRTFGGFVCDEESGELTVNLGLLSYDAENGLSAVLDLRIPVCGSGENIHAAFKSAIGGAAETNMPSCSKPHIVPSDSEFVKGLMKIYSDYTGLDGEPMSMGGGTYVHDIEGGVAFGCTMPGRHPKMHEPDEQMPVSDLKLSAAMFAQAIMDFCG